MFGFLIGTVCLFLLMGLFKASIWRHRYGYHHHHWGHHGSDGYGDRWGGRHGRGDGGGPRFVREGFGRAAAEMIKRRLRVDEDQEGIVDHALADVRDAAKEYVQVLKDSRGELAGAFRGETVDEAAIAAVFARHDEELAKARRDVVSALKQIHAVLGPDQRKTATDWLGTADRWV